MLFEIIIYKKAFYSIQIISINIFIILSFYNFISEFILLYILYPFKML